MPEGTVNVRYMVHDVDAAVESYTKHFGFTVGTHAASAFADVFRGNLRPIPCNACRRPIDRDHARLDEARPAES
jgi:hypothetical protein